MSINRVPLSLEKDEKAKIKITIIGEGHEEKEYIERLISLDVWDKKTYKVQTKECGNREMGYNNLLSYFHDAYENRKDEEIIIIVCDTEKEKNGKYEKFENMLKKLEEDYQIKDAVNNVVFYSNPITMKVILSHFGSVTVKKTDISYIRDLVKSYTNIDGYDKSYEKRKELMEKITSTNYKRLNKNIVGKDNSIDYHIPNSTDILILFHNLETDNPDWIKRTRKILDIK